MDRSPPVWLIALAVSLLVHALLLWALMGEAPTPPDVPPPATIAAQLLRVPPPEPRPAVRTRPPRPNPVVPPAAPASPPEPASEPVAETAVPEADDLPSEAPHEAAPEPPPLAEADPPPLNPLPSRIDMRFDVRYGIARGEQTLVWVSEGDTYTVTSVAAATGLVGVFYSGRFVQTSLGRITPQGLEPDMFWDQRGERRSTARFDAAHGVLTYSPAKGAPRHTPYQGDVQDTLSLFFHVALTAPPDDRVTYQVFNGRRLRHYAYEVRGEALLDTALGPLRTLHLARTGSDDGRFELWLAIDRYYLPVRVLRTDDKGNQVELTVASIAP